MDVTSKASIPTPAGFTTGTGANQTDSGDAINPTKLITGNLRQNVNTNLRGAKAVHYNPDGLYTIPVNSDPSKAPAV